MILYFIALLFALIIVLLLLEKSKKEKIDNFVEFDGDFEGVKGVKSVIDSNKFDITLAFKIKYFISTIKADLSPEPLKLLWFFLIGSVVSIIAVNEFILQQDIVYCLIIGEPLLFIIFMIKIRELRHKRFQNDFPDALNILSGALSAGQSIVHAFDYVGKQLDNEVGREFMFMGERLLIGEDPDDVLLRSSTKFPYIEYFFFAATIRLNLSRGGQLKDIITKINRIMFESRALDKKKFALTSEARGSAKIIACLPVIFLIILKLTSPENFNFVMYEDGGKPIFYYVLISELIGFFCISLILRGVD
ncbi:type II secretion system F family protein [Photobacterium sanguinicancri]|uniref:Type II secretion system F family protein n=1 Tax=Photobacterium sanguinicancri TaxID=875932 RepID=A0AAW7Y4F1_9GAMM|nr:type II secretion system F family protein [Photobacterium sanguinicancri]MDO6542900.1 type II secretion system F family protein [Photobacterium sanguinicancri]